MAETVRAPRRSTACNHKQLAEALGWSADRVDKAVMLGVLPAYDLKTPRWRGSTVDVLAGRREELLAALDEEALLTEGEMMARLGLQYGDWRRGLEDGLIPGPDQGRFWSRAVAGDLAGRAEALREQIPLQPLGASRCAALLAELTGLDVTADDVAALAGRGHIAEAEAYKGWTLYDVAAVRHLGTAEDGVELVTAAVTERQAWLENSVTTAEAARWLEWHPRDLERIAAVQGITQGRFGRWPRAGIARLAGDEGLIERVRREQLLGPDQAAQHLEIRRVDFEHCIAAGWITPAGYTDSTISRRRSVSVPLYRVGDVENLRELPGVDWEAVRGMRPGEPSPLREFARLPVSRAALVRGLAADLTERYGTEVTAHYDEDRDRWELSWTLNADGRPAEAEVRKIIRGDRDLAPHARSIGLHASQRDAASREERRAGR